MLLFIRDILILNLSFVNLTLAHVPWVILKKKEGQHYITTKGSLILPNIYCKYYLLFCSMTTLTRIYFLGRT